MKFLVLIFFLLVLVGLAVGLKDPACGLQPAKDGDGVARCLAYIPSYTYYPDKDECSEFIYGGCDGNDNRFDSKELCEAKCKE
ncbi:uncharacterized protein Dana_GF15247 [Drosophila ananassae]|uniref:BPTI/Kunitz inhibitor domain-containing protein n=1 Tax=Drosophila ananassae TaxID=7217 RepID=B3MP56_DROAN|nr:male accessory gland serine protease inhibitor [Drosophila ananassae]EDV31222.1 uncharacterized protein Dana_GF15247 [Drosophila ananassae]